MSNLIWLNQSQKKLADHQKSDIAKWTNSWQPVKPAKWWMTTITLISSMNLTVHSRRRKFKKKPTTWLHTKLLEVELQLSERMKSSKHHYESRLINSLATKNSSDIDKYIFIYSYPLFQITIRWLIATSYSIYFNDLSASDDLERAELFNKYFHLVYTSSAFTLPLLDDLPTPDTSLTNINISFYDVFQILCTLDPTKAPEID